MVVDTKHETWGNSLAEAHDRITDLESALRDAEQQIAAAEQMFSKCRWFVGSVDVRSAKEEQRRLKFFDELSGFNPPAAAKEMVEERDSLIGAVDQAAADVGVNAFEDRGETAQALSDKFGELMAAKEQAEAERNRLRMKIRDCANCGGQWVDDGLQANCYCWVFTPLRAENERLREWIWSYGSHPDFCKYTRGGNCGCGFPDALQGGKEQDDDRSGPAEAQLSRAMIESTPSEVMGAGTYPPAPFERHPQYGTPLPSVCSHCIKPMIQMESDGEWVCPSPFSESTDGGQYTPDGEYELPTAPSVCRCGHSKDEHIPQGEGRCWYGSEGPSVCDCPKYEPCDSSDAGEGDAEAEGEAIVDEVDNGTLRLSILDNTATMDLPMWNGLIDAFALERKRLRKAVRLLAFWEEETEAEDEFGVKARNLLWKAWAQDLLKEDGDVSEN